ncbi:MAG: MBOAT family protein [Pirellulaceae bacterium]|nr:MBOAT family protein [Pirellulaceae bacterium]
MSGPAAIALQPLRAANERRPAWHDWLVLAVFAAVMVLVPTTWPPWAKMWLVALAIYAGCKWLTWRQATRRGITRTLQAGYLLAWPGMDAEAFFGRAAPSVKAPLASEWWFATGKLMAGTTLLVLATKWSGTAPLFAGWLGMAGVVFCLHFGAFHLLSCGWRQAGVAAAPLMDWPIAARGVSDFWGGRWNRAFRDVTHRWLFRPLANRRHPALALIAGFVASGIVHELVISLPAGAGYGGPTLYFTLQGIAILVERSRAGRRLGLGRGFRGWLFALVALIAPLGLLFHAPFVLRVVVPMLQDLEALL